MEFDGYSTQRRRVPKLRELRKMEGTKQQADREIGAPGENSAWRFAYLCVRMSAFTIKLTASSGKHEQ
jgi:hypothetical protein